MRSSGRTGFVLAVNEVLNDILVPRYYDPFVTDRLKELSKTHELVSIAELVDRGELSLAQGNYIGKIHYGTGPFPYIRTSDIANWELRASPKHGVSAEVFNLYAKKQDLRSGDVLLVHEGTYLIGTSCLITEFDTRVLFQHHLARLRLNSPGTLTPALLMASLSAPVVQRQIRSKQLTADIIDSIVGRLPEIVLPIPKSPSVCESIAAEAAEVYGGRARARVHMSSLLGQLEERLRAGTKPEPNLDAGLEFSMLGGHLRYSQFTVRSTSVRSDILIPRYYDPTVDVDLAALARTCHLVAIGELTRNGTLELQTGHEPGKLEYGFGSVSFIRTSDFANWELKHDPKQRVSQNVFDTYSAKQSARPGDILLVRDGTYLVGSSVMVQSSDVPLLFSGGIYRIRALKPDVDPFVLFALLNLPIVRRQMRNKQFTRDVIDTLGHRFEEVVLPFPKDAHLSASLSERMRGLLAARETLRVRALSLGSQLESLAAG